MVLEIRLLPHRARIPEYDSSHNCSDSESLLDGRADGSNRRLRRLFMQWSLLDATATGRFAAVGVEA